MIEKQLFHIKVVQLKNVCIAYESINLLLQLKTVTKTVLSSVGVDAI